MALTPEILIPRLGDVLVEQGLITHDQLLFALETQKKQRLAGGSPLLGQVMLEMNLIDQKTLDQAITKQIMLLQTSLQEANQTLEKRVQQRTAELEEAYRKLSELTQLKTNFIANISHELRTPLTHIVGYLDLLLTGDTDNLVPDQKESLGIIHKASDRLSHLIEDLILFSTSETGNISLEKGIFDLNTLIKEAQDKTRSNANKRKITQNTSLSEKSLFVLADRDKVFWVVNQLLDNAIKFTSEGGNVNVKAALEGKKARLTITDTGIGIDKDKIEEIFEPFHQLDGSSTRKQGGTGLGLALVKKILLAHETNIEVSSMRGEGSSFSFLLDCAENID